jgi:hypothetical protein
MRAFTALGGKDIWVAGVGVAPAQIRLRVGTRDQLRVDGLWLPVNEDAFDVETTARVVPLHGDETRADTVAASRRLGVGVSNSLVTADTVGECVHFGRPLLDVIIIYVVCLVWTVGRQRWVI